MGLEATLPSVPVRPSLSEHLAPLDEPSGAFGPPSPRSNGPVPRPETGFPTAISSPAVPLKDNKDNKDNFDARFESVLATIRANRPHDDLDLIRAAWTFCQEQHQGQRRLWTLAACVHGNDRQKDAVCDKERVESRPNSAAFVDHQVTSHLIAYPGVADGVRGAGTTLLVDLAGSCSEC